MLISWVIFIAALLFDTEHPFWHRANQSIGDCGRDLTFASVMAAAAYLIHCFGSGKVERRRDMYAMITVLSLVYAAHVMQMGRYVVDNWNKLPISEAHGPPHLQCPAGVSATSWVKAVRIQPILKEPFMRPVGFRLTLEVNQPTPFLYRENMAVTMHIGNYFRSFRQKGESRYERKSLQQTVSFDLLSDDYLQISGTTPGVNTKAIISMLDSPQQLSKPTFSLDWRLSCGDAWFNDPVVSQQIKKALDADQDFQTFVADLPETYRQYLPENMTTAGFKICGEDRWLTHYCPSPKETHLETEPKSNP